MAHWGLSRQKQTNKQTTTLQMIVDSLPSSSTSSVPYSIAHACEELFCFALPEELCWRKLILKHLIVQKNIAQGVHR